MRDYTETQEGKLGIDPERKTGEEGGRACLDWITTIRPISSTTQSAPEPPQVPTNQYNSSRTEMTTISNEYFSGEEAIMKRVIGRHL